MAGARIGVTALHMLVVLDGCGHQRAHFSLSQAKRGTQHAQPVTNGLGGNIPNFQFSFKLILNNSYSLSWVDDLCK